MERVRAVNGAAIVTGASSGIGYAISRTLCGLGYEVFGFGRNFEKSFGKGFDEDVEGNYEKDTKNEQIYDDNIFHPIVCDILDTDKLCTYVKQIASGYQVKVLVNNAGVGYYGLHEELSPAKIKELVRTNLEAPMILTQQLLRHLKKNEGYVINISSVTANESNPHGCAYGATKAGLASFSHSLFDETRKYGVKVVTIFPDMTQTKLYRNADFSEGDEIEAYLLPEEVASSVKYVLSQREGMIVSDITMKPQIRRIKRRVYR